MSPGKVDLAEKLSLFDERWSPKIVGEMNGKHVKLVKLLGEFVALPRGVGHRPPAEEEALAMLFEPASTVKGSAGGGMTMAELDRI